MCIPYKCRHPIVISGFVHQPCTKPQSAASVQQLLFILRVIFCLTFVNCLRITVCLPCSTVCISVCQQFGMGLQPKKVFFLPESFARTYSPYPWVSPARCDSIRNHQQSHSTCNRLTCSCNLLCAALISLNCRLTSVVCVSPSLWSCSPIDLHVCNKATSSYPSTVSSTIQTPATQSMRRNKCWNLS